MEDNKNNIWYIMYRYPVIENGTVYTKYDILKKFDNGWDANVFAEKHKLHERGEIEIISKAKYDICYKDQFINGSEI